jgi:5-methyltetrahydropteroyltriglutamate--homocysteine methyltransferase
MKIANNGSFPWRGLPEGEAWAATRMAAAGAPDEEKAARDRATRAAVQAQIAAGCDLPSDGRIGRHDPVAATVLDLEGIELGPERDGYPGGGRAYRVPVVRGEISWKGALVAEDHLFASQGVDRAVKPILIGPATLARLAEDHAYGEPNALAMGLAIALNQEVRALQAAGAGIIQIDEPALAAHPGEMPLFARLWEVLGRGVSATLVLHLEGASIAAIAPGLGRLKRLGCLSLDCVAAPGNLEAIEAAALPETTLVGLGLVGGGAPPVSAEELAARVRAARHLPPAARLVLGTGPDLGTLDAPEAAARLRALVEVRRLLTGV